MCFSATASFTASGILAIIGLLSMGAARTKNLKLFAATPLFFAAQQASEGALWLLIPTSPLATITHICTALFLFFAYLFWPIWMPGVMLKLETIPRRHRVMYWLLAYGVIVALIGLAYILTTSITPQVLENHISYAVSEAGNGWVQYYGYYWILKLSYCIAVMGPLWISSIPYMRLLAVGVTLGYLATEIWYMVTFASVWCFFAALVSGLVFIVVRKQGS